MDATSRPCRGWSASCAPRPPTDGRDSAAVPKATGRHARIVVSLEASPKKTFATAVEWPGWSRSGKTEDAALEALLAAQPRYSLVAREAGEPFPTAAGEPDAFEIVERAEGGSGTQFGVPSSITVLDRRPVDRKEAGRLAGLLEAAWVVFDRVAASAPAELRKGPRGGGRDRDKMIGHVVESEWYYARE